MEYHQGFSTLDGVEVGVEANQEVSLSGSLKTGHPALEGVNSVGNPRLLSSNAASEPKTNQESGDALDDARQYWASKGFDFRSNIGDQSIQSLNPRMKSVSLIQ